MFLTFEQIKSVTQGAVRILSENGKYRFFRLTQQETETAENLYASETAGIQMKFRTDGSILKMKIRAEREIPGRTFFFFDIIVNNQLTGCIKNYDENNIEAYTEKSYPLGDFCGEFELGTGEKSVRIVFPYSAIATIEEIELVDATYIEPVKSKKKIVAYGDSITQGFDALHPSQTYVMQLSEALNAEIVNKGLGGAIFRPEFAAAVNDSADYVFVAYGTNDWYGCTQDVFKENVRGFFENITKNYSNSPIYVITPLWRKDLVDEKKFGDFLDVDKIIKSICKDYKNVIVISGWELVPHDENLFGDFRLHPSDEGFTHYSNNLLKELKCKKSYIV